MEVDGGVEGIWKLGWGRMVEEEGCRKGQCRCRPAKPTPVFRGVPPKVFTFLVLLFFALLIDRAEGIRWLALRRASGPPWSKTSVTAPASSTASSATRSVARTVGALPASVSAACGRARRSLGLSRAQARLCRRAAETMPLVARAATQTALVCGELFKERRWNCSSLELAPDLAPDLTTGTREQAFVYALSSAAVAFSVARACATGSLFACSCGATPREPPDGNFKWGGCGDNVKYGLQFGKAWADAASAPVTAGERQGKGITPKDEGGGGEGGPSSQKPGTSNNAVDIVVGGAARGGRRRKGESARMPKTPADCSKKGDWKRCPGSTARSRGKDRRGEEGGGGLPDGTSSSAGGRKGRHRQGRRGRRKERRKDRDGARRTLLSVVNLHNNRAGRRAVEWSVSTQCKCHGVSGSCSIKTCWKALPRLSDVGERLKRQYAVATEVVPGRGWIDRQDALAAAASMQGGKSTASTLRQHRIKGTDLVALSPLLPPPPPGGRRRRLLQPAATAPASDFNDHHLIYVTKSPDYCLRDPRVGSQGTSGRWCNASSHGHEGCESMCCGRGYRTVREEVVERCQCKYYWCCYVKCKTCRKWVERHRCN